MQPYTAEEIAITFKYTNFSLFDMDKRGGWDISTIELMYLILAAVVLLAVFAPMLGKMLGGQAAKMDTGTRMSFYGVQESINGLIKNDKVDECYLPFGVMNDQVFAGFSKTAKNLTDAYSGKKNTLNRPDVCREYACILLCKVSNFFDWNNNDAEPNDCIERRLAFLNFQKSVENLVWINNSKSYDVMIYSNDMKVDFMKIKKISKEGGKYDFQLSFTKKSEGLAPCASLYMQTSIDAEIDVIIQEDEARNASKSQQQANATGNVIGNVTG